MKWGWDFPEEGSYSCQQGWTAGMRHPFWGAPQFLPFTITVKTTPLSLPVPLIVCPSAWPNRTTQWEWMNQVCAPGPGHLPLILGLTNCVHMSMQHGHVNQLQGCVISGWQPCRSAEVHSFLLPQFLPEHMNPGTPIHYPWAHSQACAPGNIVSPPGPGSLLGIPQPPISLSPPPGRLCCFP